MKEDIIKEKIVEILQPTTFQQWENEVCNKELERFADQILELFVSQKQEILDDVWKLMMDCLPKDAENLSSLTDDQAGRLMRCFLAKNPWN